MLKTLMVGVALSAFALSGAMAQSNSSTQTPSASPTPPSTSSSPSSASSNMSKSSSDMSKSASSTTGQSTSGAKFVTSQSSDQWLASKFKGTDVVGTDDKKIGDVSDILFDKSGKIEAFIISVGGFLGVGSKDVAIAPQEFQVEKGTNGSSDKLKLAMTKDELKQAQNFEPYKAPSTTTGSATRPAGSPAGMAPRPAPSSTGK